MAKDGKGKRKGKSAEPRAIKGKFKDSVFCDLFSRTRYTIGLYRELHPEDKAVTEEDVDIVTISNVLVDAPYNDLGFAVGDRVIVLVEQQSTWTPNIALRALMYYAQTLGDWIRAHDVDLYHSPVAEVPKAELYVATRATRMCRKTSFSHGTSRDSPAAQSTLASECSAAAATGHSLST